MLLCFAACLWNYLTHISCSAIPVSWLSDKALGDSYTEHHSTMLKNANIYVTALKQQFGGWQECCWNSFAGSLAEVRQSLNMSSNSYIKSWSLRRREERYVTHYQSQLTDAHKDELIYPRPWGRCHPGEELDDRLWVGPEPLRSFHVLHLPTAIP